MATIIAHPEDERPLPLSAADALREAQALTRYALDSLDGSEHPGVACHAKGASVQLAGALAAGQLEPIPLAA